MKKNKKKVAKLEVVKDAAAAPAEVSAPVAEEPAPEAPAKEAPKASLVVPEVDRLRYSQVVLTKALFEARAGEIRAQFDLKLKELDVDGALAAMAEETRRLAAAASAQMAKVTELSAEIGKKLGIDFSAYNMNVDTGELTPKEPAKDPA